MSHRDHVLFLNGRFVRAASARISPLDRGLLFGDGLFETIRVYAGRPFALEAHLDRLRAAARRVELPMPRADGWWRRQIETLLRRNGLASKDAAVRLTVTRGVGGDTLLPPRRPKTTTLLTARPLSGDIPRLQAHGVDVVLLPFHPGLGGLLAGIKTTDYLTAALGKACAREHGAFEGLYVAADGRILEGTTSNLFVVRGGALETPPIGDGVLPGVTRGRVLEIARSDGLSVHERSIPRDSIFDAEEAFLTASTIEIVPIRRVDGVRLGSGQLPRTRRIQALFRSHRQAETARGS